MAIPDLHGSDDNADICLMYLARTRSASTKTEIRFETKELAYIYVAKTSLLTCSLGLGEMGCLKGTKSMNHLTLPRFAHQAA